jgi:hypothetical protein
VISLAGIEGWMAKGGVLLCCLLGMTLAGLVLGSRWLPSPGDGEVVLRETPAGTIQIPISAIREFLEREAIRRSGIDGLNVRLHEEGGRIAVSLDAYVTLENPLPLITEDLQDFIRSELIETVGLDAVGPILVNVKRLSPDTRPLHLHHAPLDRPQEATSRDAGSGQSNAI